MEPRTAYVVVTAFGFSILQVTVEKETEKSYILRVEEKKRRFAESKSIVGKTYGAPSRVLPKPGNLFFSFDQARRFGIGLLARKIEGHRKQIREIEEWQNGLMALDIGSEEAGEGG